MGENNGQIESIIVSVTTVPALSATLFPYHANYDTLSDNTVARSS